MPKVEEGRTLLKFYHTNHGTFYGTFLEGVETGEILKLCGMMELAKADILKQVEENAVEYDVDIDD